MKNKIIIQKKLKIEEINGKMNETEEKYENDFKDLVSKIGGLKGELDTLTKN